MHTTAKAPRLAFALAGQVVTCAAQAERIARVARETGRDYLVPQCESVARQLRAQGQAA